MTLAEPEQSLGGEGICLLVQEEEAEGRAV